MDFSNLGQMRTEQALEFVEDAANIVCKIRPEYECRISIFKKFIKEMVQQVSKMEKGAQPTVSQMAALIRAVMPDHN